jgi:hypothetical protein
VFGSSPAVTVAEKGVQLLSGPQWYQLVKDTLGGDPVATNKVMGANAKELYGLE